MKTLKKGLSLLLAICMMLSLAIVPSFAEGADDSFVRIFHLDCGRKYFSVDQIEALIDTLAENNYTHMELAIGNDGLRFLLDNMSVTANDTTYTSDEVKAGIQAGNKAYYNAGTYNELTESEMDTIIAYANEKGIEIIPLLNTPGHMDAILDCMESVGISNPAYNNSARTVDVTNTAAVNFTLALVNKYIQYFAGKGCTYFNMGCDEYANDKYESAEGMGFGQLQRDGNYAAYIKYVNAMADQVNNAKMTPMAFNDGFYYDGVTDQGTFDESIVIAFWTSGWGSNYLGVQSAATLAKKGHKIINTNDAWYWVLGRTSGTYALSSAQNGVQNTACTDIPGDNDPTAAGCMICLWCDTPSTSYSDTEVSNVTGLLSTFAANNPTYFVAASDSDNTDDTETELTKKTITVTVGGTNTDTIKAVNCADDIDRTELNESIATVSAEYKQVSGGTEEAKQTSITSDSSYYIKNSSGQYLSSSAAWVSDISSAALWTATSSGNGYTLKNGNNYLRYQNSSLSTTTNSRNATTWSFSNGTFSCSYRTGGGPSGGTTQTYTLGDAYTVTTTNPVDATTVTFTGVAVGTTHVTVGNVYYTIEVIAEDLSKVTPLTVEYWITNVRVTAGGATSKSISASEAYGEDGVDLSTLVPEVGSWQWNDNLVLWHGTVLDSSHHQTEYGDDQTDSGNNFMKLRYYDGKWAYYYDDNWVEISTSDQVVAYWLQKTDVTKEISTLVKDWGFIPGDANDNTHNGKVALSFGVVYPDGTVSPSESEIFTNATVIYNYETGKTIGYVAPVNNSTYTIDKITYTYSSSTTGASSDDWSADGSITWDKVENEDGSLWYNETVAWEADNPAYDTVPAVNGTAQGIKWNAAGTGILILIYLKPVHYDTNLIVNWVDDSASSALISTMEVAVSSDGTRTTFYNGLKQTSDLPTEGVGGTFTLDDDAYVTNSSNVNQTFNKNISTVPGVADVYKTGLYQYVSADLSADGMTLTLHYNIDSSKVKANYVVDFGLPVNIPLADLVENVDAVEEISFDSDSVAFSDGKIVFTPSRVITETIVVKATVTFKDETTTSVRFAIYPATTVYYEEGFAKYTGSWTDTGSKGTDAQATQVAGQSKDEYGYDAAYNTVGASNGTQATSSAKSDKAEFTFTGTGVDIYANSTTSTGSLMIKIASGDSTVKLLQVNTALLNGTTDATGNQAVEGYNIPVASVTGLTHGSYTVTITHTDTATVNLDGFRVYGTLATEPDFYADDLEDNPTFIELRDQTLAALGVTLTGDGQVSAALPEDDGATVAVVASDLNYTQDQIQDLLDNGPKNEIYLQPGMALVLSIKTDREVQIGLKALNAATNYTIGVNGSNGSATELKSSTDMFYTVMNNGTTSEQTITITNKGEGILAVTKLKVCDDPTAALATLTEEDLTDAYVALGIIEAEEPTDPETPVDPEPTDPDPEEPETPVDPEPTDPEEPETPVNPDPEPEPEPTPDPEPEQPAQPSWGGLLNALRELLRGIFRP